MADNWNANYKNKSPILQQFAISLPCRETWPTLSEYNEAIPQGVTNANNIPIQFVAQSELTDNYETMIYQTGRVPTREQSWHDFFNAHVWINFPKTKAALNALQYQCIQSRKTKQRTTLENKLTLFDEGGALIICDDPFLLELLASHRWETLFFDHRDRVLQNMKVYIFGHSLHEKALNPYIGMTAHCLCITSKDTYKIKENEGSSSNIDEYTCKIVKSQFSSSDHPKFQPLPILGYPGWHFAEQNRGFYNNREYFRP